MRGADALQFKRIFREQGEALVYSAALAEIVNIFTLLLSSQRPQGKTAVVGGLASVSEISTRSRCQPGPSPELSWPIMMRLSSLGGGGGGRGNMAG